MTYEELQEEFEALLEAFEDIGEHVMEQCTDGEIEDHESALEYFNAVLDRSRIRTS